MKHMSEEEVMNLIGKAIAKQSGESNLVVSMGTSMGDLPSWDSLAHLRILMDLDEAFGGKVAEISEIAAAHSVQAICDILKKYSLLKG